MELEKKGNSPFPSTSSHHLKSNIPTNDQIEQSTAHKL